LASEELDGYEKVYRQSMEELMEMMKSIDNGLIEYAGIKEVRIDE